MKINSIQYRVQTTGLFSGQAQLIIDCAFDNTKTQETQQEPTELTIEIYKDQLKKCRKKTLHAIAFQGGEPLLQIDQLKALLKPKRDPVLVKTNGSLPNHLLEVVEQIDFLELMYRPGFDDAFLESLSIAQLISESAVVYPFLALDREEVTTVSQLISSVNRDIPFISSLLSIF